MKRSLIVYHIFDPEDGGNTLFRNVGKLLPVCTVSYHNITVGTSNPRQRVTFPCLIDHYIMKTYRGVQAYLHALVSFTPRGNSACYSLNRRLGEARSRSQCCGLHEQQKRVKTPVMITRKLYVTNWRWCNPVLTAYRAQAYLKERVHEAVTLTLTPAFRGFSQPLQAHSTSIRSRPVPFKCLPIHLSPIRSTEYRLAIRRGKKGTLKLIKRSQGQIRKHFQGNFRR